MLLKITSLQASPQALASIGAGAAAGGVGAVGDVVIAGAGTGAGALVGAAGAEGAVVTAVSPGFTRGKGPATAAMAGFGRGKTLAVAVTTGVDAMMGAFGE